MACTSGIASRMIGDVTGLQTKAYNLVAATASLASLDMKVFAGL